MRVQTPGPGFFDALVHFTKDSDPFGAKEHESDLSSITGLTAFEGLMRILGSGTITATPMRPDALIRSYDSDGFIRSYGR
jgi:hypothetical protein